MTPAAQKALDHVDSAQKCTHGPECGCWAELRKHAVEDCQALAAEVLELRKICGEFHTEVEELRTQRLGVLFVLEQWGGNEEAHHLRWVVDQVARRVLGDGYAAWVAEWRSGDGPNTYTWDVGIAP